MPDIVWERLWDALEGISDESGEQGLGDGYLLRYEGWGGICVDEVWRNVEAQQRNRGLDIDSEQAREERDVACCEHAELQSSEIIDREWSARLRRRGYRFVAGGYEPGGLYGRTWALFKKERESRKKRYRQGRGCT